MRPILQHHLFQLCYFSPSPRRKTPRPWDMKNAGHSTKQAAKKTRQGAKKGEDRTASPQ
jgi:hypothetical protein